MMRSTRTRGGVFQTVERLVYSPINYYAVLIVDGVGAAVFLLLGLKAPMSTNARFAAIVAGFAAWGFLEYSIHRWVGHGPPSIARRGHAMHHSDYMAPIAAPVFVVMGGAFLIWAALALLAGTGVAGLLVCGLYIGYNHYALVHHVLHHHEALARVGLQRLERGHRIHHVRHDVNFGVTSTLWDRIFRTHHREAFSKTSRSYVTSSSNSPSATSCE
jgi:sterol desaturase/sphingolipid hydroxylase (fatty acid hydroxylase superfamily)